MHACFQLLTDEGFDLAKDLFIPISFSRETGKLSADKWGVRLEKTVMTGKRKRIESAILTLTFCPMCGVRLIDPPSRSCA